MTNNTAPAASDPSVYLYLLTGSSRIATQQCIAILPLSTAKESIAKGTGRLIAVDAISGRALAASRPADVDGWNVVYFGKGAN